MRTGATRLPRHRALVVCALAAGCASTGPRDIRGMEAARADGWALVENVAEIRQSSSEGCGAAALAMVLGRWGQGVTQQEIWAAIGPPPGEGIRADALRDFARRQGFHAFLVEGRPADLAREVGRNRPVLVGMMKRQGRRSYPHYEVVIGFNRKRERILTLDPARGPRETAMERFAEEWAAAGRLTLVVFPRTPATVATAR